MKFYHVSKMLFGACIVYVAMAACSATPEKIGLSSGASGAGGSSANSSGHGVGGTEMTSSSGSNGSAGSSTDGGLMDVIMNPVPEAQAEVSGSRLKAKFYKGADGSRAPAGWYDSERGEDCQFSKAADGVTRCIPISTTYGALFGDASCSIPLAYGPAGGCFNFSYLAQMGNTSACNASYRYFPIMGPTAPGTIYSISNGSCSGQAAPSYYDYYEVGAEVPLSSFAAMTIEVEP